MFWPEEIPETQSTEFEARGENIKKVERMCSTKYHLCDTYHQGSSEFDHTYLDINSLFKPGSHYFLCTV